VSETDSSRDNAFKFDKVFETHDDNDQVWQEVESLVHSALLGHRLTVMTVGATNSGKTYTSMAIVSRAVTALVAERNLSKVRGVPQIKLEASVSEAYQDEGYDLLTPPPVSQGYSLPVKTLGHAVDLNNEDVDGICSLLNDAVKRRRTRDMTKMKGDVKGSNKTSSRGHVISTFCISRSHKSSESAPVSGSLTFIDLAGSEKHPDTHPENKEAQLESTFIRTSLSELTATTSILRKLASKRGKDSQLLERYRLSFQSKFLKMLTKPLEVTDDQSYPRVLLICTLAGYESVQKQSAERMLKALGPLVAGRREKLPNRQAALDVTQTPTQVLPNASTSPTPGTPTKNRSRPNSGLPPNTPKRVLVGFASPTQSSRTHGNM
jgi:hypothetical protein